MDDVFDSFEDLPAGSFGDVIRERWVDLAVSEALQLEVDNGDQGDGDQGGVE